MYIKLDFNSDEAIYIQLCDQIIYMIAKENLYEETACRQSETLQKM